MLAILHLHLLLAFVGDIFKPRRRLDAENLRHQLNIALCSVVTGGLMLWAAFRLDADSGRWWLVFGGVVSLAYGALLIVAPIIGALVLTWWLGAYALIFGVALLVLAFRLRARMSHGVAASQVRS